MHNPEAPPILGVKIFLFCLILYPLQGFSQQGPPLAEIQHLLDSMSRQLPGLNEPTTLSMKNVTVPDYIRAIGVEHKVNVDIVDNPTQLITSNLTDVPVKEVFLLICKKYQYQIEAIGTILQFIPYKPPPPALTPKVRPPLKIKFEEGLLSVDLARDSLFRVLKELSRLTGRKILAEPGMQGYITAFLPPTPVDTALDAIFSTNGLYLQKQKKGYAILKRLGSPTNATKPLAPVGSITGEAYTDGDQSYIRIDADNAQLETLLRYIFDQVEEDYLIYEKLDGEISLHADLSTLEQMLNHVMQGTPYTFKKADNLFLIGKKEQEGLHKTEIVHMNYRPTYQAIELIPGSASRGNMQSPSNRYELRNSRPQGRNGEVGPRRNPGNQGDLYSPGNGTFGQGGFGNQFIGGNSGWGGTDFGGNRLNTSPPPEIEKTTIGQDDAV